MIKAWFQHPSFAPMVEEFCQSSDGDILKFMRVFRDKISDWNRRVFGNIPLRKYRCLARLAGIQKALSVRRSSYLIGLDIKLRQELHDTLAQEESLWRQKSRIQWLSEGERSTKFFHLSVLQRRRRNLVSQLKDDSGVWCLDAAMLKSMARSFYANLYTTAGVRHPAPHCWNFPVLSSLDRDPLNGSVTADEIKQALFQMGPDKAPGPDGFSPGFFQQFWSTVGDSVVRFVQDVFRTGLVPPHANAAIICLIPKVVCPEHISQFQPIALCNVLIKIVSKVLANRLQLVMPLLTGPCQSSFISESTKISPVVMHAWCSHDECFFVSSSYFVFTSL